MSAAHRPTVTLKLATSLDGRIALADGASKWITGPEARAEVHAMRAAHDAVMTGITTLLTDDAELTARPCASSWTRACGAGPTAPSSRPARP